MDLVVRIELYACKKAALKSSHTFWLTPDRLRESYQSRASLRSALNTKDIVCASFHADAFLARWIRSIHCSAEN